MTIKLSTPGSGGYTNPLRSLERKMAPDYASREFRDPGLRSSSRPKSSGGGGLGSLRHTMPHLRRSATAGMDAGGPVSQIYAGSHPNLYNPDPLARRILSAVRQQGSRLGPGALMAAPGSNMQFPYAEGGAAPPEELMEPDEDLSGPEQGQKQIVIEAMLALEGRHPDPERALKAFVEAFGPDALGELKEMMSGQQQQQGEEEDEPAGPDEPEPAPDEQDDLAAAGGGLLRGPGSGQSDEIAGTTPSGRPVLLSDGEYVIDAPTVAALGDGSTDSGARRLDEMRKKIRKAAYGHDKQAKPMARGGQAVLVEIGA